MKIKDRGPSMRRLWAVTALLAAVVGAALFHRYAEQPHHDQSRNLNVRPCEPCAACGTAGTECHRPPHGGPGL